MKYFIETLTSNSKSVELPEEFNYFGKLGMAVGNLIMSITTYPVRLKENGISRGSLREWRYKMLLFYLHEKPEQKYHIPSPNTARHFRVYNPATHTWDIAYCYTGRIMRLEARKQDDMIVLTNIDDEKKKWAFVKIEDNTFHWQNVTVKDNGEWLINADLYAVRTR